MSLLNYVEFGEGRPIIILHGLFGSARNWQGIAREISKSHRVITPDLRNHGQSSHFKQMSYLDMADDVINLIEYLKLEDIILMGHSMGGKVAMTSALLHPDRFTALINVDIAPVQYTHNFTKLLTAMTQLPIDQIKSRNTAEKKLAESIKDKATIQLMVQNMERTENGFKWRINIESICSHIDQILGFPEKLSQAQNRSPSLFIGGAESDYLRPIHNERIFQLFPAAEIKMIEDAGHWLHVEKPKEFIYEINSFIHCV